MTRRVALGSACRGALERAACATYPSEACGVLLGRQVGEVSEVSEVTVSRNLHEERPEDHYVLDPVHLLEAYRRADAEALEVLGIWHSHPDGSAMPSEADREGAWTRWSYLIVSVDREGPTDLRCWRLEGGSFAEVRIEPR